LGSRDRREVAVPTRVKFIVNYPSATHKRHGHKAVVLRFVWHEPLAVFDLNSKRLANFAARHVRAEEVHVIPFELGHFGEAKFLGVLYANYVADCFAYLIGVRASSYAQ